MIQGDYVAESDGEWEGQLGGALCDYAEGGRRYWRKCWKRKSWMGRVGDEGRMGPAECAGIE